MAKLGPDDFRKRLEKALRIGGGSHAPEDVAQAVAEGRMQSWVRNDTLVVTEVIQCPRYKMLVIFLAVGRLEDVLALTPEIEAFGREHGCQRAKMTGREGWAGVLPKHGWHKVPHVSFERAL